MKRVPWTSVASWECRNCGTCCRRLRIVLTREERSKIASTLGGEAIVEGEMTPELEKVNGRCLYQRTVDGTSRCLLQKTGLKPSACRTFPFMVSVEPLRPDGDSESSFNFKGRNVHIYVSTLCPSVQMGSPSGYMKEHVLPEAVQIALGQKGNQRHTTSQID